MKNFRKPYPVELKLIEFLIIKSEVPFFEGWKENLLVIPLNDGKMGSLELISINLINEDRVFGKQISDFQFKDKDNVDVIASLNIDNFGNLFELDMWKTDFSPLLHFPDFD